MCRFIFILISVVLLSACQMRKQEQDAYCDTNIEILRYDRLQYEATVLNSFSALQKMNTDCPQATKLLIEDVLAIGSADESDINERLCSYYADSILIKLMEDAEEKFKDMTPIEKGLTQGFRELKKELPSIEIPRVYSFISALNQSIVVGDNLLGFSIDKYMGADYPLYERYYYAYQRRSMEPDRILTDCFTFYLLSQYPFSWMEGRRTLLDIILYRGKIAWIVGRILGYDSDGEMVLGYTKEEMKWCKKNKAKLWLLMKEQKHLASTDPMMIRAYTYPDPSVIFKGEKVPSLIGVWMGVQLIDAYMKHHKDVTVEELLLETDCREWIKNFKF